MLKGKAKKLSQNAVTKLKHIIIGKRAVNAINSCIAPGYIRSDDEKFNVDRDLLPGADHRHTFLQNNKSFGLSPFEKMELEKDYYSVMGPFRRGPASKMYYEYVDIPKNSYYMVLDDNGLPVKNEAGEFLYKDVASGKLLEREKLPKKKDAVKLFWLFDGEKKAKRLGVMPVWRSTVKGVLYEYVDYMKKQGFFTDKGMLKFEVGVKDFIGAIEGGRNKSRRWETIYKLFNGLEANHRYLMSKTMSNFDQMLADKTVAAANMNLRSLTNMQFREFAEAVVAYVGKQRGGNFTVLDALPAEDRRVLYGRETELLFKKTPEGVVRVKKPTRGPITKEYLMQLTEAQQIEQLEAARPGDGYSIDVRKNRYRRRVVGHGGGWALRFVNAIGKPWILSTFMSLSQGFNSLIPLLTLNSSMFLTEIGAASRRLDGNWEIFLNKYGLQEGLRTWYEAGGWHPLPYNLGDVARKVVAGTRDALEQGLFNAGDTLMQGYYRVHQLQTYFQGVFPGVTTLDEVALQLEYLKQSNPAQYEQILHVGRQRVEESIRMATTNTPIKAALARIHATEDEITQSWNDVYYTIWHFFAGWGWNKMVGFKDIAKAGLENVYRGRVGAQYLDELLKEGADANRVHAKMLKAYLENEAFRHTMARVYTALVLGKFIDRSTESESQAGEENIGDDFWDTVRFFKYFSGNRAAMESTPEFKVAYGTLKMLAGLLENDADPITGLAGAMFKGGTIYGNQLVKKLFVPKILATMAGSIKDPTDKRSLIEKFWGAVQDATTGFLYYTSEKTSIADYDMYTPLGANARINRLLYMPDIGKEKMLDYKDLNKHLTIFNSWDNFKTYLMYNSPLLKNYKIALLPEYDGFKDDLYEFTSQNEGYRALVNGEVPNDLTKEDYLHLYHLATQRNIGAKDIGTVDQHNLKRSYEYLTENGEKGINLYQKMQEDILHQLTLGGLTSNQLEDFLQARQHVLDLKKSGEGEGATAKSHERLAIARANIVRLLAPIEANSPGKSVDILAYMMSADRFDEVFNKGTYVSKNSGELYDIKKQNAELSVAKKYAPMIIKVDRGRMLTQILLHYAKTHDPEGFGKWIEEPKESHKNILDLRLPGGDREAKHLKRIFTAEMVTDLMAADGNVNAYQVANSFSLVYDLNKSKDENGDINPKDAAVYLSELKGIYGLINTMPMEEHQLHNLKMGTLLFADQLVPHIMRDGNMMKNKDMENVVRDWTHHRFSELKELDEIAREQIEDDFMNRKFNREVSTGSYNKTGRGENKKSFYRAYSYIKNRAYSSYGRREYAKSGKLPNYTYSKNYSSGGGGYSKYRVFNRIPQKPVQDYLRFSEYLQAKEAQMRAGLMVGRTGGMKRSFGKANEKDGIGVQIKTGRALQFYKREDIDKPVEYKTPWRKRWVRKGAGNDPISSSTWKRLSAKIKPRKG